MTMHAQTRLLPVAAGPAATEPPEKRTGRRDLVRLLVADGDRIEHAWFTDLAHHLEPGDLVVVNDSATLPAAIDGTLPDGVPVTVHVAMPLDDGSWIVEVRPAGDAHGPLWSLRSGTLIRLDGDAALTLLSPYPEPDATSTRLWRSHAGVRSVPRHLRHFGRPIRYSYVPESWALDYYQTVFASQPGSAEMPSAGRPFTAATITALSEAGVGLATVTLHTGLSSAESGEPPVPERFVVPARTARLVNQTRCEGHRVIATGTTVTRALETVAHPNGLIHAERGWTGLVLGPDRPSRVVEGIITGWHMPGSSHLDLLTAVVGPDVVQRAYAAALDGGYLWHEFGDSALLFRHPSPHAR